MLEAKLSDPMIFVTPMRAAFELVKGDVVLKFDNEGLVMRAMDPANVAMVSMKLSNLAFDEYNLSKDEVVIGVNMERLIDVLKRADRKSILGLKVTEDRLIISYLGKSTRRFTLPLLSLEEGLRPEPNLSFTAKVAIDSDILKQAVEDAKVVSDALVLIAEPGVFKMVAQGDLGSAEVELKEGDEGLHKLEVEESAKAKYSIEYLKKMVKAVKISDVVTLNFKTDYPLKMTFKEPEIEFSYILAPRMDVD